MSEKAKVPYRGRQGSVEVCVAWAVIAPFLVFFVWLPRMLLCQFVDTHDARGRGEEQPTVLDVRAWAVANHVLNVVVEAVDTWVNTGDKSGFSGSQKLLNNSAIF